MRNSTRKNTAALAAISLTTLLFAGCKVAPDYKVVSTAWQTGDVAAASAEFKKAEIGTEKTADEADELIWLLDSGLIAGLSGDYDYGWENFDLARGKIDSSRKAGESRRAVEVVSELIAPGPYICTPQEAVMVPVFQIYNALGKEDRAAAFNMVVATEQAQKELVAYCEAIAAEQEKEATSAQDFKIGEETGTYSPMELARESAADLKGIYGDDYTVEFNRNEIRASVLNPFAYWLCGAVKMNAAEDAEDLRDAKKHFAEAMESSGGKGRAFYAEESRLATAAIEKGSMPNEWANTTYVIYEGGRAPAVGSAPVKIKIPTAVSVIAIAIAAAGQAGSTGCVIPQEATAYFPRVLSRGKSPKITVNGEPTTLLYDFDTVVQKRFRTEAAGLATSAVIKASTEVIIRAAAIVAARLGIEAAKDSNQYVQTAAVASFETAILNAARPIELSHPDVRTWSFLPRTLEVAKVKTPPAGEISISGDNLSVPAEGVNIVRIRKETENWPTRVQVYSLSDLSDSSAE